MPPYLCSGPFLILGQLHFSPPLENLLGKTSSILSFFPPGFYDYSDLSDLVSILVCSPVHYVHSFSYFFESVPFFFAFLKVYLSVIDLQCCDNCCCVVFVLMKQRDGAEHFFSLNCFLTSVEFLDVFSIRQLGRPSES